MLVLLAVAPAFADSVEVIDFAAGKRIAFTDCTIYQDTALIASCGARAESKLGDEEPPNQEIWPRIDVHIFEGCAVTDWSPCFMTAAQGLPGSGTAYRMECPDEALRKGR